MLSSKGLKGLILSFVLLISLFTVTAFADSPISVYLDGELLQFDVAPRGQIFSKPTEIFGQ